MSTTELLVQIDGDQTVPLLDCTWVLFAPCGCMSGATVTGFRDEPYASNCGVKATEAQAWEAMYDSRLEREQEQKLGFEFRLLTKEQFGKLPLNCEHDPKWGIPARPQPEGMTWAVSNAGYSGPPANARLHLVKADHADETWEARRASDYAKRDALCGSTSTRWRTDEHLVGGHIDCTRCIKLASEVTA